MKVLLLIIILTVSANLYAAECTTEMQAFNQHQLVVKGMLDLTLEGKIDKPTVDAIAVRQKEALDYQNAGEYQKACDIYDSILDDYGFDKSFGEAPAPENKETDSTASDSSSDEAASAVSSDEAASTSSDAAPASE